MNKGERSVPGQACGFFVSDGKDDGQVGGQMAELIDAFDWAQTGLGPLGSWPQSLRMAVNICLGSPFPTFLCWGKAASRTFYNDACVPLLGSRHPLLLGQPLQECWSEVWAGLGALSERAFAMGQASCSENFQLFIDRPLFCVEAYFTLSCSPVLDDTGHVGGTLCMLVETTQRVLGERRLRTLQELSQAVIAAETPAAVCQAAARSLEDNPQDLPFALLYLLHGEGHRAMLSGSTRMRVEPASPGVIEVAETDVLWPLQQLNGAGEPVVVEDLAALFRSLPGGVWPDLPGKAVVLPFNKSRQSSPLGFLVAGISPHLEFNGAYKAFICLLGSHIAAAVARTQAELEISRLRSSSDDALRFRGAQFETLLNKAPLGVYLIDADFMIREVNPVAQPVFGDIPGGVIGRDFDDIIHILWEKDFADELVRIFRWTLESGESYEKPESTAYRADRYVTEFYTWRIDRITLPDGRYGVVCYFREISQQIYAYHLDTFRISLADSLRSLSDPLEIQAATARLLSELLDVDGAHYAEVENEEDSDYYVVREHYRVPGIPGLIGRHRANDFGSTLFDKLRAGRTVAVANIATEPTLSLQEREAYADTSILAYVCVPLIKHGRHVAFITVHQSHVRQWSPVEIAVIEETAERTWASIERARAEANMLKGQIESARQRRFYEGILNNTPDLAYIFNPQHCFVYANEGLLKMWGKTMEEAVGKTCLELGYEPWHAEMHEREVDQVIATGQPVRGEVPFSGAFGRRIYDYILVPIFGPNGEVEAVAGTTRDITESREADRRKDEFLATLAHELRNPLAPIRSSIQVLALASQGDAKTDRVYDMMERQVSHMVRLVDDLMEVSRISRGAIELRKEWTTLADIIRSAVDTSTPLIEAAEHRLMLELPQEPVPLFGDPVRLAQVVSNLLNNAAKYTDRGGDIWLSVTILAGEIVIRVRDNGIGIAVEALPLVFDMFMQVEHATGRLKSGLGIGLSLVKHLVEMHGGSVVAHSDGLAQGSEFHVRLPCHAPQDASVQKSVAEPLPSALERRRVLVVDDNQDAATSLAMLINVLGSQVEVARDGVTALALIESYRPHIVLLDLGMPGMNGLEVAQRAKQIPGAENLTLIALTGWGQQEDRERTRAAGFDHHLVKPADITELQLLLSTGVSG